MIQHGKASKYSNDGCRCPLCTAAWAKAIRSRRRQRREWVAQNGLPASVDHGWAAYTNWGCHCEVCRKAAKQRSRQRAAS